MSKLYIIAGLMIVFCGNADAEFITCVSPSRPPIVSAQNSLSVLPNVFNNEIWTCSGGLHGTLRELVKSEKLITIQPGVFDGNKEYSLAVLQSKP